MPSSTVDLRDGLKRYFGYNDFRPYQNEIINEIVCGKDVLAILPTGAGKSLCYQLPAMMLPGIAIIISPLISLMQDQVVGLNKNGIPAAFLNSSLRGSEVKDLLENLSDYKLLFLAPERFASDAFLAHFEKMTPSFFAIDEAHCISQWGHSFRPEYRQLSFLKTKYPQCPILALTATATPAVEKDIIKQIGMKKPVVIKSGFDRPNLTIRVNEKRDTALQLREFLGKHRDQSGIIYCATRKGVESTYLNLKSEGFDVGKYHAGMNDSDRSKEQHSFIYDQVKLMVATVAFGMGIHKPDIRFIVHIDMPKTVEQYYQEIGRAGRDGLPAECLMLYDAQDLILYRYFITQLESIVERKELGIKLEQIYRFCSGSHCRRIQLLNYFGEEYPRHMCENCDNCLDDVEWIDGTLIAQKILSCIYRMGQNFGAEMVIDVLRGSKNQKVLGNKFDKLSTYNLMHDSSASELRYYIQSLVNLGVLKRSEGEYPILECNEESQKVVKGTAEVKFRKKSFKDRKKGELEINGGDKEAFERLRELRRQLALVNNIPAYEVFSDRSLMEMITKRPTTRESFLEINGVGLHKWNMYGKAFIKAIHDDLSRKESNSSKDTIDLFQQGKSIEEICEIRGLQRSTVSSHLATFNLKERDINRLVSKEKQAIIKAAIVKAGCEKLKALKEILPENITYEEIRFMCVFQRIETGP